MVKMTILYRHPESIEAFEAYYNENLALLEKMPHITRRQVNMITGGPGGQAAFYKAIELYFEDFAALDAALTSPEGQAAGQHLIAHAAQLADMFFAEVYEEAGGQTPRSSEVAQDDSGAASEGDRVTSEPPAE